MFYWSFFSYQLFSVLLMLAFSFLYGETLLKAYKNNIH